MERSLPSLEPYPLSPLARLGALVPLAARLPSARAIAPANALSISPGPIVWSKVVEPQGRRKRGSSCCAEPAEGEQRSR